VADLLQSKELRPFLDDIGAGANASTVAPNHVYRETLRLLRLRQYPPAEVTTWRNNNQAIEALIGAMLAPAPPLTPDTSVTGNIGPTAADRAAAFLRGTPQGPREMILLKGMGLGGADVVASLQFGPKVRACVLAARAAGHKLVINNCYRDYDPKQSNAAQGGTSNHRYGNAVDFDIANSGIAAIDWVHANKNKFGLKNELWNRTQPKDYTLEYNHFSIDGH
jgi:hypothetical protein